MLKFKLECYTSPTEQTIAQWAEKEKHDRIQQALIAKKKAAATNPDPKETEDDEPPQAQQDKFTATTLKLKALEKEKAILNALRPVWWFVLL